MKSESVIVTLIQTLLQHSAFSTQHCSSLQHCSSFHEVGWRRLDQGATQALLPITKSARELALDEVHELIDFELHGFDFAPHVQDDLDSREVDAKVTGQREDRLELLEIVLRVEPRVALRRDGLSRPSRSYSRSVCGWMRTSAPPR